MKINWIIILVLGSFLMTSCEDDPLLEEMPSDQPTGGSYGKSTFENIKTFEEIEQEACSNEL